LLQELALRLSEVSSKKKYTISNKENKVNKPTLPSLLSSSVASMRTAILSIKMKYSNAEMPALLTDSILLSQETPIRYNTLYFRKFTFRISSKEKKPSSKSWATARRQPSTFVARFPWEHPLSKSSPSHLELIMSKKWKRRAAL
jgi:hypothetical protein